MANLKVSQEVNLGLGGIDGSVEYRVIKGGNTYKQSYADLFSYINSNVPIPDLQQVLTAGNTTTNDNLYIGLVSGGQTGTNNVGIGVGALAGGSGGGAVAYSVGIGEYAGQSDSFNGVAIGGYAGQNMNIANSVVAIGNNSFRTGRSIYGVAIGVNAGFGQYIRGTGEATRSTINIGTDAGTDAQGDYNTFIGLDSGRSSIESYNVGIGFKSQQGNEGTNVNTIGQNAGYFNLGDDCFFAGRYAGYDEERTLSPNVGSSVIGIGYQSAGGNNQNNVIGIGDYAAINNTGIEVIGIGLNSLDGNGGDYNIGIGSNALGQSLAPYNVGIGYNAGYLNEGENCVFIGASAGDNNQGNFVVGIGSSAGQSNQENNSFIISNSSLPSFATQADAILYYTAATTLSAGCTYLYYIQNSQLIGAYRT
jgi:trimeric autotransporter adhesin